MIPVQRWLNAQVFFIDTWIIKVLMIIVLAPVCRS